MGKRATSPAAEREVRRILLTQKQNDAIMIRQGVVERAKAAVLDYANGVIDGHNLNLVGEMDIAGIEHDDDGKHFLLIAGLNGKGDGEASS